MRGRGTPRPAREEGMPLDESKLHFATLALHGGQTPDPTTHARAVPIYATTSYVFDSSDHAASLFSLAEFGNIYSRLMNPTCDVLEKRLAALDGGVTGLSFASGQSAITAALCTIVHSGQNFLSSTSLYGGTWTLFSQTFKKLGIEVRFFDPDDPKSIERLADKNTRCVYLESLGNPEERRPRLPGDLGGGARHRRPRPDRQHGDDAGAAEAHRPRLRHRDLLAHQVPRRPRRPHRRRHRRQRPLPVGGRSEALAGVLRARPVVSRRRVHEGPRAHGQHRVQRLHPDALAAGYGRRALALCSVPVPAWASRRCTCACRATATMRWPWRSGWSGIRRSSG